MIDSESLVELRLKSKVFDISFSLLNIESVNLNKMLVDNKPNSVFQKLIELRKVKVDIWRDVFKKYFNNSIEKKYYTFY